MYTCILHPDKPKLKCQNRVTASLPPAKPQSLLKEPGIIAIVTTITIITRFMNAMGPFLPFLIVPLSFFFRTDYFQRDVHRAQLPEA